MAEKKTNLVKIRRLANTASILLVVFLGAGYIIESLLNNREKDYYAFGVLTLLALFVVISIIRKSILRYKMAFNIPFVLLIYYTLLMILHGWHADHYFFICLIITAISCIYSHFAGSLGFIVFNHILIGLLILLGFPIGGQSILLSFLLINWAYYLFASIIMLILTSVATIQLDKAAQHQQSFMDLLATTENYVAIVDEYNKIIYASKTLAMLGNVGDHTLVQGRPLIDLFPGRSLKVYAGKLLKEKEHYTGDWEFTLDAQKRYFKVTSHKLAGDRGDTLISLYDMTHLAERDEIAAMKDSMQIGLFFMDKNYVIQDHYSRYLEEMLVNTELVGKLFTDIIADSVTSSNLDSIREYFRMVVERSYDKEMLDDINPLEELYYVNKSTGDRKVFQCAFDTIERERGEVFVLVTVYDITTRVELQKKLAEEEARRHDEMQSVFEFIKVQPSVFSDFMNDMEYEFTLIEQTQKNDSLSTQEVLVKIYQSVHAIKSNAVILGLSVFGNKVHNLESKIKKLREAEEEIPFADMLDLAMDIEKIFYEKEGFGEILEKLQTYVGSTVDDRQHVKVLVNSFQKTAARAADDQGKLIDFIADDVDDEAVERCPKHVVKEIVMQLIRNSAVHGIEMPDDRKAKGKKEAGIIKLSINMSKDRNNVVIRLSDDGNGLDYKKISEKALSRKIIEKENAGNKDLLTKVIFAPGFSTSETEGMHAGRGIGLNLVRDRLKEIKGSIKLRSENGKGIQFLVTVPVIS
ncbi:MAG: hypothetical protein LBC80_07110 [Treponema sp.]|jgi:two-component system chemotaxis sensor kinase CheA|nr:hypothetical protein [Treponema sp.]